MSQIVTVEPVALPPPRKLTWQEVRAFAEQISDGYVPDWQVNILHAMQTLPPKQLFMFKGARR